MRRTLPFILSLSCLLACGGVVYAGAPPFKNLIGDPGAFTVAIDPLGGDSYKFDVTLNAGSLAPYGNLYDAMAFVVYDSTKATSGTSALGWTFSNKGNPAAEWDRQGKAKYLATGATTWFDVTFPKPVPVSDLTNFGMHLRFGPKGSGFTGWFYDAPGRNPTPELSSGALLLLGMLPVGLAWWRRRRS
jgi:hypothetical protein